MKNFLTDHQESALMLMAADEYDSVTNAQGRAIGIRTAFALEKRGLIKTACRVDRSWSRTGRCRSYCDVSCRLTDKGWKVADALGVDVDAKLRAAQREAIRLSAIWATDRSAKGGPAMNMAEAVRWSQRVAELEAARLRLQVGAEA